MVDDTLASRNADLRRWRAQFPDAAPLGELPMRQVVTCVGVVRAIRFVPGRALEVTVEDGTGSLVAVWSGRSQLPGLDLGIALRLRGTVAAGRGGTALLRNPEWTLVGEPYA